MLRTPAFGKGFGGVSVVVGAAGVVAGFLFGVTSTVTAAVLLPLYVGLPILLGWKVYRLSKTG